MAGACHAQPGRNRCLRRTPRQGRRLQPGRGPGTVGGLRRPLGRVGARPRPRLRDPDEAVGRRPAAVAGDGPPHAGRGGRTAGQAGPRRPPLQGHRLERRPDLRLHQAVLSAGRAADAGAGVRHRRAEPQTQAEGRFLHPAVSERPGAQQLPGHQSGGLEGDHRCQGRKPGPGPGASAGRHGAGPRTPEDLHDRRVPLRGRQEPGGHARQGGLPEPAHGADSVRTGDGAGTQAPAAIRAALDQQVLRSGSAAQ